MKYSEYIYSYLFITWIFAIIFPVYFFIEAFLLFLFFENEYLLYLSCFMISFSIITFLVIFFLSKFFFHFKFKSRLLVLLKSILNYININFKRKNVFVCFKYSLFIHILDFINFCIIFKIMNIDLSLSFLILLFIIIFFIDLFPITPQNLGFSELMAGLIMSQFNFSFTAIVFFRLFLRFSNMISSVILFLISYRIKKFSL